LQIEEQDLQCKELKNSIRSLPGELEFIRVCAQSFPVLVNRDHPKQAEGKSTKASKQQNGTNRDIVERIIESTEVQ
jgi:hypothetical protein